MNGEIGLYLPECGLKVGLEDLPEFGLEIGLGDLPEFGLEIGLGDLPEFGLDKGQEESCLVYGTGPILTCRMAPHRKEP